MSERCQTCGKSLGTFVQETLFGDPKQCIDCLTTARIDMMLKMLAVEDDAAWERLTAFEQEFFPRCAASLPAPAL